MMLVLSDVLRVDEVAAVRAQLDRLSFVDGSLTAGQYARTVKRNEQLEQNAEAHKLQQAVLQALIRHPGFDIAAGPKAIKPFLFSRYEPGMEYGIHVDNAIMSGRPPVRSDISMTVFLSHPGEYDGGELIMESGAGELPFKLPPGSAILYPSTALHRVAPVTRGVRTAAVTWIQSLVREPAHREILHDLETARRSLFEQHGKGREFDLVSKSFANLLRMWADV